MKLFSYCLRHDGGSAPNPYGGICTLVICKPAIRRTAKLGDWIVGLGSANSPIGDIWNYVVYAMKVTSKMTMKEYDQFCTSSLPEKIPNWRSQDYRLRMGDCIYDYGTGAHPKMRRGAHGEDQRRRDLSGKYALLSTHFYYFGDQPVRLPEHLYPIIHATQGHKSHQNEPYAQIFVDWLESLGYSRNMIYGEPQFKDESSRDSDLQSTCSTREPQQEEIQWIVTSCQPKRIENAKNA